MSDNRLFRLECCALKPSLEIAFGSHKATHFKKYNDRLIFAWTDVEGYIPFLVPLIPETAEPVIKQWLADEAVYPPEPDHDGHNTRSWLIFNEDWGIVDGKWQCFMAIEPCWAMYGK